MSACPERYLVGPVSASSSCAFGTHFGTASSSVCFVLFSCGSCEQTNNSLHTCTLHVQLSYWCIYLSSLLCFNFRFCGRREHPTVREIAKTVYMVTSSKWRRCSKLLEFLCYGPFSSVTFRLHCYVKPDFAHVHLEKE